MLMGRYDYVLDSKNRTNFPPKFRAEMGEVLYITRWFDKCLVVYSREQWKKLDDKVGSLPITQSRELRRKLYGSVVEVTPDKQGRIVFNEHLKEHANITKDIVVIGARDYAEIWDKATYEENDKANDFAVIEAQLADLEF